MPEIKFIGPNDEDIIIPARWEVCPRCDGEGSHVNPSIDGHGLSSDDFAEDPDFAEAYFSGAYDVPCEECRGRRVVLVPDESDPAAAAVLADYYAHIEAMEDMKAAYEAERRMGA